MRQLAALTCTVSSETVSRKPKSKLTNKHIINIVANNFLRLFFLKWIGMSFCGGAVRIPYEIAFNRLCNQMLQHSFNRNLMFAARHKNLWQQRRLNFAFILSSGWCACVSAGASVLCQLVVICIPFAFRSSVFTQSVRADPAWNTGDLLKNRLDEVVKSLRESLGIS